MSAVLVVEDSLTVRMDLVEALEGAGMWVVACATLGEAREALRRQVFALAVLDVMLPDGDGVALVAEIRADPRTVDLRVMLLSSESEVRDRVRGLSVGADEYIGKPYDRATLVGRARALLGSSFPANDLQTVLVVDDSPTYRGALRQALEQASYHVIEAATGEEGLLVAATARPSAMIVDGVLPGMDGATVIRRVRLDGAMRRTPCVLLTASDEEGAELRALDAGADAFVRKDDDVELVLARLAAVLRSASQGGQVSGAASLAAPKRILAVDDSPTFLDHIATRLRGDGYEVALARSGEEALELLAVQPVDCILLDLLMPGLGGTETCRRIKAAPRLRDIPLLMLTALEDREAMIEGLAAGADDYIAKSSDLAVLKARVLAQIRRKQFEDENRRIREQLLRHEIEIRDTRAARELAEARAELLEDLEVKNRELEAFCYSVSHDLRAPLRSIDGFSQALLEDCGADLDPRGQHYLRRVRAAAQRMGELIDDLLELSRVSRVELRRGPVDLSALAGSVLDELRAAEPARVVRCHVEEGLWVEGDGRLLRIALENLLGNAWKFSRYAEITSIEVGCLPEVPRVYFVRDNGVGFDMTYVSRLFAPFQRLHAQEDFPGTGIGLATIARILDRHGGRIWVEAEVDRGATFSFTLQRARRP